MENEVSSEEYYSLLELIEKLGKEGVADLVRVGSPKKITKGEMIYFLKSDVNKILEKDLAGEDDSVELIVDDLMDSLENITEQVVFKETIIERYDLGNENKIYSDRVLDLKEEILYGRSSGYEKSKAAFKSNGIISSVHGKLFLDEGNNLLYENLGVNKSKVRGCRDKKYNILEAEEIAVLIPYQVFSDITKYSKTATVSIKIGYQNKPQFIIRITASKK